MTNGKDTATVKPKAIGIIGMHRSGTSAVARAVNLLGVYLGEEKDLMKPGPDNPEGYWERTDICRLQDRMLDGLKKKWHTVSPPSGGWHKAEGMRPFRDELIELINRDFSGRELWAWKDPRTSLFFDLWKDVLMELGIELACLYVVRNPLDVARSLEKRNGFPPDKAFGLWFNYNITALKASASVPRVFVSYDRFLDDWEGEMRMCSPELGIPWPGDDRELRENIGSFVRPELRHSASGLKELVEAGASEPVLRLYELLSGVLDGTKAPDDVHAAQIEKLSKDFTAYARFFEHDMAELWERGLEIVELKRRERHLERRLTEKDKELTEKDKELTEKNRLLAERDRQIHKILNSMSWRITAPIRALRSFKK